MIGTLATLALILPDYTVAAPGPFYAPTQLIFVAVTSLALYALFIFVQTVRHRGDFLDEAPPLLVRAAPLGPGGRGQRRAARGVARGGGAARGRAVAGGRGGDPRRGSARGRWSAW